MELTVRGTDVTISPDLRDFANTRVSKLDRFIEHLVDAKLELKRNHRRNGSNFIVAQLTIQTGRDLLRAEESDSDARKAIGLVVEKMESQVRRVGDRRTSRKKAGAGASGIDYAPTMTIEREEIELELENGDAVDIDIEEIGAVVRTKRFQVKPMDVDEAIEQMELLGHDFFLFHNADENAMNVLYRRKDGTYGLLAPHSS